MSKFQPIAIVGIGCRFPGAHGPEEFWRLLAGGVDAITEVPPDRWSLDEYFDPDASVPGKMTTRWGGFLSNVDQFDAAFFGISPREAEHIDPQQRLLMEVAWEALEDAGLPAEKLAGQPVGVFVGMSSYDYGARQLAQSEEIRDGYLNTGSALSIGANRLSYLFDFRGPSLVIDTACSSSLVATYYACQSLDRGDSCVALAGGVNLILSPTVTVGFSKLQALAPDGRCKAFDARANGYVRAEGAGVVVLKPLAQAVADGDRIHAVIRGGAINQDGRTNGLTAPNGLSQEALVRDALASAGLQPADLQYVEAHGTGTALGDPIELNALGSVLASGRAKGSLCGIGSAKSNIGHLEAAAGVAGLIKLALMLEQRQVPASLHFEKPNPYIRFDRLPLRVVTALEPWSAEAGQARGGVSAFGFGGTNSHVILEEPPRLEVQAVPAGAGPWVLPLSAKNEEALKALARAYADGLTEAAPDSFAATCATAALRRSHHDVRLAAVARSGAEMAELLRAFLGGEAPHQLATGRRTGNRRRKVAFVFAGQGPQWWGMGRALFESEAVFRRAVEDCDAHFRRHATWSLIEELAADEERSRLGETEIAQPALFALQVGLAALWRSRGITPDGVVGHSLGEAAAAHVAGVITLSEAVDLVFHRSRLMQQATGRGRMVAVEVPVDQARAAIAAVDGRVSIAAVNSPASIVLAGDAEPIEQQVAAFQERDVLCRYLPVNYAFHSYHMEPYVAELRAALAHVAPRRAAMPLYSTVTGAVVSGPELGPDYWGRNLRQTVEFAGAIDKLIGDGLDIFVEISPHPTLLPAIQQCLQHANRQGVALGSLRRHENERETLLAGLGNLYALGRSVDWSGVFATAYAPASLPPYPWQRQRYWLQDRRAEPVADRAGGVVAELSNVALVALEGSDAGLADPVAPTFVPDEPIRAQVLAAPVGQGVDLLADRLRQHTAVVLRLAASKIDLEQPLITMGIDSLMAVELIHRVEKDLGVAVPLLEVVKGPSLVVLARMLLGLMTGTAIPETSTEPVRTEAAEKSLLLSILSMKDGDRT